MYLLLQLINLMHSLINKSNLFILSKKIKVTYSFFQKTNLTDPKYFFFWGGGFIIDFF